MLARIGQVMPDVFARIGVDRDDRRQELVVALALAAHLVVIGKPVTHPDIETVELSVVGQCVAGGTAAVFPLLAGLGGGSHHHGLVLEAQRRIAGHVIKGPQLAPAGGVVTGDVAARPAAAGEYPDGGSLDHASGDGLRPGRPAAIDGDDAGQDRRRAFDRNLCIIRDI